MALVVRLAGSEGDAMLPENMSRQQLEARILELNMQIAAATSWGAALAAMDEERTELVRALRRLNDGPDG